MNRSAKFSLLYNNPLYVGNAAYVTGQCPQAVLMQVETLRVGICPSINKAPNLETFTDLPTSTHRDIEPRRVSGDRRRKSPGLWFVSSIMTRL